MRHRITPVPAYVPAYVPGMVVHAIIRPRGGPAFRRPGLIMQRRLDDCFGICTFTVNKTFENGNPRPIIDWQANHLNQTCYLFSQRLAIVPPTDIRGLISIATPKLLATATTYLNWPEAHIEALTMSRNIAAGLAVRGEV